MGLQAKASGGLQVRRYLSTMQMGTCGTQRTRLQRSEMSARSNSYQAVLMTTFAERADLLSNAKAQRHKMAHLLYPANNLGECMHSTRRLTWFLYLLAIGAPLLASKPCVLIPAMILTWCLPQSPLCPPSATIGAARDTLVVPSKGRGTSSRVHRISSWLRKPLGGRTPGLDLGMSSPRVQAGCIPHRSFQLRSYPPRLKWGACQPVLASFLTRVAHCGWTRVGSRYR